MKTAATSGRSEAMPVSFSTMEARMTAASGVVTTVAGERAAHRVSSWVLAARCMRATTAARVSPRVTS